MGLSPLLRLHILLRLCALFLLRPLLWLRMLLRLLSALFLWRPLLRLRMLLRLLSALFLWRPLLRLRMLLRLLSALFLWRPLLGLRMLLRRERVLRPLLRLRPLLLPFRLALLSLFLVLRVHLRAGSHKQEQGSRAHNSNEFHKITSLEELLQTTGQVIVWLRLLLSPQPIIRLYFGFRLSDTVPFLNSPD